METATEWLFNKLLKAEPNILEWNKYLEQAKEKEKEQIIDAYKSGVKLIAGDIEDASNYYYNQKYNNEQ